jgi:hypothetical protein
MDFDSLQTQKFEMIKVAYDYWIGSSKVKPDCFFMTSYPSPLPQGKTQSIVWSTSF